ncbi:O-antigen ligase family protein [Paenibacillus solisilvae]|uniref:O-antigen ligase family protein n=1 Tax=Paenibacillus solisilvae TaxID=2486751 RepID=A0ABW0VYK0_9BACL
MKKKNPTRPSKNVISSDISLLQWAVVAAVTLFLFIFPFQVALFNGMTFDYEGPLFGFMIFSSITLLILGIRLFKTWRFDDYRFILSLGALSIPFMYMLSSINAVSAHNAKLMMQLEFVVAAFFIIGLYVAENKRHMRVIELAIQLSGYVVVLYGLMNLFGQAFFVNALWLADNGYRLTSIFQYSNSYAAFLTALFLAGLFSAIHTKHWYWRAAHSFMLVPIWLSLMLTYSRAALVFIPFLILIILPFLRIGKQILYLIYMVLAIVSSFAILSKIAATADQIAKLLDPASNQGKTLSFWNHLPLSGWSLVLGISVLLAAIITFMHSRLSQWLDNATTRLGEKKWSYVAVPALFIVVGVLAAALVFTSSGVRSLLPASIADRIESINLEQHSVLERETFYKDAFKLAADYPILGAGGGAWGEIYEKYQNNPYSSKQTHSYYLQTLVEIGWLGLIVLLGFLAAVYYLFIRAYIKNPEQRGSQLVFFIISLSILVHSSVDFDMSYMYLSALVFLGLGAMLAPYNIIIPRFTAYNHLKWRLAFPAAISLMALVLFFWVYREYDANVNYNHALEMAIVEKKPLDQILPSLDKAIKISPDHPDYTLRKLDWMKQAYNSTQDVKYRQEQEKLITQLKHYAPYNRLLFVEEYQYYKNVGKSDIVLSTIDEALTTFPWDMNFYEAGIMEYYLFGDKEKTINSKDTDIKWNHSLELYKEVLNRIEYLKSLPTGQLQGREFKVTPTMRLAIGQIYYNRQMYHDVIELLKEDINGDFANSTIRSEVHTYLDALQAIGQKDEALSNKLAEAEKKAQEELEKINK